MTTVQKIHNDFYSVADKLIEEAKGIISKDEKAERMKALGFHSAKRVVINEKNKKTKEWADYALNYLVKYPMYKFITVEMVESLCKKYNLYKGNVGIYKGDIPAKNLSQIEAFEVNENDIKIDLLGFFQYYNLDGTANSPKAENKRKVKLFICAPKKDFKLDGMKINKREIVPEDPIVLAEVNGGYLIVTAWGDEATDENVINEINN